MKRLITLIALTFALAAPVSAETVRTCSSAYGGGEVCGETTTTHTVVETGVGDTSALTILAGTLGFALLATILYKLTYKSYILG
jgi:hypothetical protein